MGQKRHVKRKRKREIQSTARVLESISRGDITTSNNGMKSISVIGDYRLRCFGDSALGAAAFYSLISR